MFKRLWTIALAVAVGFAFAACVSALFPGFAWAGDATADVTAIPVQHPILAIMIPVVATVTRLLQGDVTWFPSWLARYRLILLAGLSLLTGFVDKVTTGSDYTSALVAAMATGAPALVVELFHLFGKGGGGSGGADGNASGPKGPTAPTDVITLRDHEVESMRAPRLPRVFPCTPIAVAIVACTLAISGCKGGIPTNVGPLLTEVVTDAQDAITVVDAIKTVVDIFFLASPNPEAQAKVLAAIGDVHLGLDVAIRATKGAQDLTAGQREDAWQKFNLAFEDLGKLLKELGIVDGGGKVAARRGAAREALPEPLVYARARARGKS